MRTIVYSHFAVRSVLQALTGTLFRWIAGRLLPPMRAGRRLLPWRRLVFIVAVVITLVVEALMLYWLAQLVELCLSLMEVWTELAAKHLEITLDATR